MCAFEVCALQVDLPKLRFVELGALEMGAPEVRIAKYCTCQLCVFMAQAYAAEIGARKVEPQTLVVLGLPSSEDHESTHDIGVGAWPVAIPWVLSIGLSRWGVVRSVHLYEGDEHLHDRSVIAFR